MDKLITMWQGLTIEQLVITLLMLAVFAVFMAHKNLSNKYHSLNTLTGRLCDQVYMLTGVRLVKQHRSGDYEPINPLFDRETVGMTQKGSPMPQSLHEWKNLGELYEKAMLQDKLEISALKKKINRLDLALKSKQ